MEWWKGEKKETSEEKSGKLNTIEDEYIVKCINLVLPVLQTLKMQKWTQRGPLPSGN